jgi:hypothetical protein
MVRLEQQVAGVKTELVIEDPNRFILMVTVCLSVKKEIYDLYWNKLADRPGFMAQLQITNIFPQVSKKGKNHYLKVFYRREETSTLPIDYIRFFVDRCKRRTYETLRYLLEEEYKMWKQMQMPEQLNMDL